MSEINSLSPVNLQTIILRLGISLAVGGVLGFDREIKNKPAGLRTHMLVSLGSALFALVPLQLGLVEDSSDAMSRVLQGIVTGLGFIGGGVILREHKRESPEMRVRGLTSAAAIWVSSALGIASGCGLWDLAFAGAIFSWLVLTVFGKLENFER